MNNYFLSLMLVILGISLVTFSVSGFYSSFNTTYNQNVTNTEFKTFQKIDELNSIGKEVQKNIQVQDGEVSSGSGDLSSTLLDTSFKGIQTVYRMPGIYNAMITDASNLTKDSGLIPPIYIIAISVIVLMLIAIAAYRLLFRTDS